MNGIPQPALDSGGLRDDAPDRLAPKTPMRKSEIALTIFFVALLLLVLASVSTNKNFK
jgi:hypothetical protein